MRNHRPWVRLTAGRLLTLLALAGSNTGCSPTVKLEAPDKPIVINLNVKIEEEVRVHIEKDVDSLAQSKPGVF
ncbi:MAG: YnbE family lipoprotein [Rhodospirillaceae bacterium]|nr:MAG: YnbE family lipoprotein [Rhodospirillaceae bacterium]